MFLFQEGGGGNGEYGIENGLITFELGELVIKRIFYRSMTPLHVGRKRAGCIGLSVITVIDRYPSDQYRPVCLFIILVF